MNKILLSLILALGIFSVGCDDVTSEKKTHYKHDDGTTVKDHKKVTENEDGDKTVTHERSVDRPNN